MKKLIILLSAIYLVFTHCSITRKGVENANSLIHFDRLYIYDNKSDTIIKNFNLFDSIAQSIPVRVDSSPENNFVPMPGSTYLETIMFYSDNSGTVVGSLDRNWSRIYAEHLQLRKFDNKEFIISNIKVSDANISFTSGHPSGVQTTYIGRIANDSLYLSLSRSKNGFMISLYPDASVRVYGLQK